MKVRDFTKISLQHFAITRQPNPFAVVVHFLMNESLQLSPILPVQTFDIFTIGSGKVDQVVVASGGASSCQSSAKSAHRRAWLVRS
jgi:hypothetical protein